MKTSIAILLSSIFSISAKAQPPDSTCMKSLGSDMETLLSTYGLKHSYTGTVAFLVNDLKNSQLESSYWLVPTNNGFDTLKITDSHQKMLAPKLLCISAEPTVTIIAPVVLLEDPKKGPNGNIMYYDLTVNKLFQSLSAITGNSVKPIILPLNTGIKNTVIAN